MSETERYVVNQSLDLKQILQEAHHRWLRPAEICEILQNYQKFYLTTDPPVRPPAGSLFLFDRKVLRYFRKDGHRWRKKKDGKTVSEAHEKLKSGSVDVLHCYYAHGEDSENFQRRCYWMLDERLDHIVLVHYREVKEGYKLGLSRSLVADPGSQLGSPQTSYAPSLEQSHSPSATVQMSYASSPNAFEWNEQALSSEFEDRDFGEDPGASSIVQSMCGSISHDTSFRVDEGTGFPGASFDPGISSSLWPDVHGSSRNLNVMHDQKPFFEQLSTTDFLYHKLIDRRLDADGAVRDVVNCTEGLVSDAQRVVQEHDSHQPQFQNYSGSQALVASTAKIENGVQVDGMNNGEARELKTLDSFGRWMDKEIGGDCDDSLMASNSSHYWNTLGTENDDKEVSRLSRHMQLDTDELSPSLSQEQLFSICDFAPDWAYSGIETKVLITGSFLQGNKQSDAYKWCCMFGEIEVSAEVLTDNVVRCQVPFHAAGRVPFYVTCSNRLACSEVREFEYREKTSGVVCSLVAKGVTEDEVHLQIQLARMLYLGQERKYLDCSVVNCDKCKVMIDICLLKSENENGWGRSDEALALVEGSHVNLKDVLIQNLLKDKLFEWLVRKTHEEGKGLHILNDEGQGVIHLAAAIGYEWVMGPIVVAGLSPNFRDARGRTALHWASYYGREETVIALVRLGASPGAVDDPTPTFPGGRTAADLASSRGHKGIAGYLAEADLSSHLASLTMNENRMDSIAISIATAKALETAGQNVVPSDRAIDGELSLKGSLAAFRKSAHAAALIQAAFRNRSFRHRELTKSDNNTSEVDLVALGSLHKVQKMSHFNDYLHFAAIKIQQKYRGWKGRKEYLKMRNRIVKIQAHVRGHQVRKQYKKVVWSVSIVEKAILRWRRKKPGLRGFRMENPVENTIPELEKNDEYEYLRIGRKQKFAGVEKALARVQSMVRHPDARDQYMRLVTKFESSKLYYS